jgi:imidazoleglycerol phosphate dehydratase HisB
MMRFKLRLILRVVLKVILKVNINICETYLDRHNNIRININIEGDNKVDIYIKVNDIGIDIGNIY